MQIEKLKEALLLGESRGVQFQSSCGNIEQIGPVVCSFLNASGGYIVCGVESNGKIVGVDESETIVQSLRLGLQKDLTPKSLVSIQIEKLEGKALLVVEVPAGKDLPY